MHIGLAFGKYDYPSSLPELCPHLAELARIAEEVGFYSLWSADHLFQFGLVGPAEDPMLEAYTFLGFLAGVTQRVKLGALVTSVVYRQPGLLIKQVTTLVGGRGEKKTLRLVAQYADAYNCNANLFSPEGFETVRQKLEVLKQHCAEIGRDYERWTRDSDTVYLLKGLMLSSSSTMTQSSSRFGPSMKLTLAVGIQGIIMPFQHHIAKIERNLSRRTYICIAAVALFCSKQTLRLLPVNLSL